jgi:hypothetical protein
VPNTALKAARQSAGYPSQQALAEALSAAALQLGLAGIVVSVRQVRRWESDTPPWPQEDYQRLLTHVLHRPVEDLGFRAPWDRGARSTPTLGTPTRVALPGPAALRGPLPRPAGGRSSARHSRSRLRHRHRRPPPSLPLRRPSRPAPGRHRARRPRHRPPRRDLRSRTPHPRHSPGRDAAAGGTHRVLRPTADRRRRHHLRACPPSRRRSRRHPSRRRHPRALCLRAGLGRPP